MAEPLHVHIENVRWKPAAFQITPEFWAEAARRHPGPAARVRTTFGYDGDIFDEAMPSADILLAVRIPMHKVRAVARRLRWVHITSAGIEKMLPLDWLPDDVVLTLNNGVHGPKTRESVMMALLALNARLPEVLDNQRAGRWEQIYTPLIAGKTVAIVGFGEMGRAAAEGARTLGLAVIAVTRGGAPHPLADMVVTRAGLHLALERADFLVLAAPLTDETRGMIGAAELEALRPGAGIVNYGRGGLIDHEALRRHLGSGRLGGAVLDVFDPEPLPTASPLWKCPRLIMTPHVSSDDPVQSIPRSLDLFFANLERFLAGAPLENVFDRERGY